MILTLSFVISELIYKHFCLLDVSFDTNTFTFERIIMTITVAQFFAVVLTCERFVVTLILIDAHF